MNVPYWYIEVNKIDVIKMARKEKLTVKCIVNLNHIISVNESFQDKTQSLIVTTEKEDNFIVVDHSIDYICDCIKKAQEGTVQK